MQASRVQFNIDTYKTQIEAEAQQSVLAVRAAGLQIAKLPLPLCLDSTLLQVLGHIMRCVCVLCLLEDSEKLRDMYSTRALDEHEPSILSRRGARLGNDKVRKSCYLGAIRTESCY